nr:hypothetical protein [Tanacetum cinerariifolium]
MYQHLLSLGRSSRSKNPRPSKRFFPPCTHCGSMDPLSDDYLYYPICGICGIYDHETYDRKKIISLEREINPRNPQHPFKRCEVCGSFIYTTTDHYDIECEFGGVGDEEVVVGEGVVVTSSSLKMLTNSCLGGIMVSLIFLKGLEEEALVEFMVELFEEDDKKSKKYGVFN